MEPFKLYQWVDPGHNGKTEDIGEFATLRAAVEAARRISKISKLKGHFGASQAFSEAEQAEKGYHGTSYSITLEPAPYFPHQEITLSDGRVVWLEDVDELIRLGLDDQAKG